MSEPLPNFVSLSDRLALAMAQAVGAPKAGLVRAQFDSTPPDVTGCVTLTYALLPGDAARLVALVGAIDPESPR